MKKIIVSAIVIGFLLSATPLSIGIKESSLLTYENILYVGGTGPGNYSTIQAAIDAANDGDTVFVYSGTYYENVVVGKTLNIIGEDMYTTIIDAGGIGDVVVINYSQGVHITGFTMRNSGLWVPVVYGPSGIFVNESDNIEIYGNIITENQCGIWVSGSSNNLIYNCKITNNIDQGINLVYHSSHNTVFSNVISGNEFGMWIAGSNNHIYDCEVSHNNDIGITLDESSYNNISTNNIVYNPRGIDLYHSSHNEIFKNIIDGNHNGIGLYWESSSYNVVKENNILNTMGTGIELWGKSSGDVSYNVITENNVTNNEQGFMLREYTSENEIYHNNIADNIYYGVSFNAWDLSENHWDNGKEGNYWGDYTTKYPNAKPLIFKNWIWNTPYEIGPDGYNKDMYPLIKKYNGKSCNNQQYQSKSTSYPTSRQALTKQNLIKYLISSTIRINFLTTYLIKKCLNSFLKC